MSARRILEIALGVFVGLVLLALFRSCSSSRPDVVRLEASSGTSSTTALLSAALTEPTTSTSPATSTTAATLAPAPPSTARPAPTSLPERASRSSGSRSLGVFEATCYELRGTTASGTQAGPGSIAVDPRVIPLGTRLHVEGYGDGTAVDTGSAIKGRRIDVWKSSGCREWGRRSVLVEIRG